MGSGTDVAGVFYEVERHRDCEPGIVAFAAVVGGITETDVKNIAVGEIHNISPYIQVSVSCAEFQAS